MPFEETFSLLLRLPLATLYYGNQQLSVLGAAFTATSLVGIATYIPDLRRVHMVAKTLATTIIGVEAVLVEVEAQCLQGKGHLRIVGLPDSALREARERVRCAIKNSGFTLPDGEVVVSLAPAELPKTGSGFDLAIALAILASCGKLNLAGIRKKLFLGELALDGRIKRVNGALGAALLTGKGTKYSLVIPDSNSEDVAVLRDKDVFLAGSLLQVVEAVNLRGGLARAIPAVASNEHRQTPDFADVHGQLIAKRAVEIAAAGGHNLLLAGPPGSGKSMIAQRIPSIMPALSEGELIEVLSIQDSHRSYFGEVKRSHERPFRAPHHSCSVAGLVGGGTAIPHPGEISLAHQGILFLDELPEFRREALESLRQPMESRRVTISRANRRITLPADFVLVAAMNPCPCGHRGSRGGNCTCTPPRIRNYLSKLSGPVLDRIDLQVWVSNPNTAELAEPPKTNPTLEMRQRVQMAREKQQLRSSKLNSSLTTEQLSKVAELEPEAKNTLVEAIDKFKLTARSYMKSIRVARTIADLAEATTVSAAHAREALSYRIEFDKL